ncbi:MAG: cellulase family glycosylhydrolase [Roseburia sp.]|nr:cellulase family glycosylhydrolase [Roseburia sp.]
MKKKTGIILCVAGVLLCMVGVAMIAYSMGVAQTMNQTTLALTELTKGNEEQKNAKASEEEAGDVASENQTSENQTSENQASENQASENQASDKQKTEEEAQEDKGTESIETEDKETENRETEDKKASSSELAVPSQCGALSVDGTRLVDENGNPVQLRGISTHGLSWFPTYVNQEAFRQFRQEWNVNVMRLAMYTYENGGYCTDGNKEDLKNIIYRGVQYATDYDMYVIIDWHVLQDQNPNTYKEEAKQFFADMSGRYKDNNNVIYEICNEPNGGVSWSDIKSYAEEVIGVIRENDEDAVILVGTPNWSQRVDEAAENPITDFDNIMYTLHFYAATHKDDLRDTMVNAIRGGLPVFVSEYGICDASGNGALDKDSARKWVDTMDEYGVSYVCWALANKNESAALIKSSSNKTSQFGEEDLSESGKWLYQMLTGKETAGQGGGQSNPSDNADAEAEAFESGGLQGELTLKSSWDADGGKNYQYDLVLTNAGSQATGSWAIDIHFSSDIKLASSWGGNCTVNGNTLHITSLDYNGKIAPGDSLKDIGFIIEGPSGLTVTK